MKIDNVLVGLEERSAVGQFIVIAKKGNMYRVDPNPNHHSEDWENAWTDDISKAHPFSKKEARKFMVNRAKDYKTEMEARRDLTFVDVVVDDGVPSLPEKEKKGGMLSWLRSA
jgi:hypothetical protein